jgi:hypothetical protein
MSYVVVLTEKAAATLASLEPPLQQFVETHLLRLGDSPSTVSRSTVSPPYPSKGMMYEFDGILEDKHHYLAVFFCYSQDETTLSIIGIGHRT